ncbi:hypothetical protein GGR50DRAFT_161736 [Xylaria sp. CBS 124048]|nr:hypothetical protein GGR50DRAFT_161736 [Xylaria sp. CBS 124048]
MAARFATSPSWKLGAFCHFWCLETTRHVHHGFVFLSTIACAYASAVDGRGYLAKQSRTTNSLRKARSISSRIDPCRSRLLNISIFMKKNPAPVRFYYSARPQASTAAKWRNFIGLDAVRCIPRCLRKSCAVLWLHSTILKPLLFFDVYRKELGSVIYRYLAHQ